MTKMKTDNNYYNKAKAALYYAIGTGIIITAPLAKIATASPYDPCRTAEGFRDTTLAMSDEINAPGDDHSQGGTKSGGGFKGIGGTGAQDTPDQHQLPTGIGGTGTQITRNSPVFVSGTIHAFGSICVNGVRITYDEETKVKRSEHRGKKIGQKLANFGLNIGQVVDVIAHKSNRGDKPNTLKASQINVRYGASGAITAISENGKTISVDGKTVKLQKQLNKSLKVGDNVRISGLTAPDGSLIASYVETLPANALNSVKINKKNGKNIKNSHPKQHTIPNDISQLSVQGFVSDIDKDAGKVKINGHTIAVGKDAVKTFKAGSRVIISARRRPDGIIRAREWSQQYDLMRSPKRIKKSPARDEKKDAMVNKGKTVAKPSTKDAAKNTNAKSSGSANNKPIKSNTTKQPFESQVSASIKAAIDKAVTQRPALDKPDMGRPDMAKPAIAKPAIAKPAIAKPTIAVSKPSTPERIERPIAKVETAKPVIPEKIELPFTPAAIEAPDIPQRPDIIKHENCPE